MRKFILFFATVLLFVVLCCSVAFCDSRYEFFAEDNYLNKYYIDTQSISVNYNIIKLWIKRVYSTNGRNDFISGIQDKKRKKLLQKISHTLDYIEINLLQNTYRIPESIFYNKTGNTLDDYKNMLEGWSNIPPNSIIESARNIARRIIQDNSSYTLPEPFIHTRSQNSSVPSPRSKFPAPAPDYLTPYQRQEWQKLQEFNVWLASQSDFQEFNTWYISRLQARGLTPAQVNQDLYNQAMAKGGKFTIIIGIVSSWYREFYQERYGNQR